MELAILMSIAAIAGTVWYGYKRQKRSRCDLRQGQSTRVGIQIAERAFQRTCGRKEIQSLFR